MKALSLALIIFFYGAAVHAADVRGKVLNPEGAPVASAKVVATKSAGGNAVETSTAADGMFTLQGLGDGLYTITVSMPSGQPSLRREVSIGDGATPVQANFQFRAEASQAAVAAEERNPNIFVYRIDLNELRTRLTVGRGPDPTYITEFRADQNYFGGEFGASLFVFEPIRPRPLLNAWHGNASYTHNNSKLNARNFFTVGPLRASRLNGYSVGAGGPLFSEKVSLLVQYGQSYNSGYVNGNILVPQLSERAPRSADPRVNAVIGSLLKAFPLDTPNLSSTRLNSNALRSIDTNDGLVRLDVKKSDETTLAFRYTLSDYAEDPFQLVVGQNPQTNLRNQSAHSSITKTFSPKTIFQAGFYYDRPTALLEPTKRFQDLFAPVGITNVPDVDLSSDASGIGPGSKFPRHRVQNRFQIHSDLSHSVGKHTFRFGGSTTRVQLNDLQSDNNRGTLVFQNDFGRTSIQNFLLGIPTSYTISLGNLYRGFRYGDHALFIEDQVKLTPTFSVRVGLRYELMTNPQEVNGLTKVGLRTDKNNFAPKFGFAWNPGKGKTTYRGAYGISYSSLFPVTFGMTRFNPPSTQVVQVFSPDLLNVLTGGSQVATGSTQNRSSLYQLSPDLAFPYSHQYNFGIERSLPWGTTLRAAYIGMRSFHILTLGIYNRAGVVPGIPITTATINQRRPDQRYYDINRVESNSISYYDALSVTVDKRLSKGLALRASYAFGKSIDTGGDFTNTASGVESPPEQGTAQCEFCDRFRDQKGLSLYDTTHYLSINYSYNLPFTAGAGKLASKMFSGWQVSGNTIFQSGTPYHIHSGSDAVGNLDGVSHDRPNITNPSILGKSVDNPDTSKTILDRSFFNNNIPPGGRGNLGYNTFRKDGTNNWNIAIGRTFHLPGGRENSLNFRTEFVNLFNHAQFEKPGVQYSSRTFGEITNTMNKGRQIQFALRLNF